MKILKLYGTLRRAREAFKRDMAALPWVKANTKGLVLEMEKFTIHYEPTTCRYKDRLSGLEFTSMWYDESADAEACLWALTRVQA